MRTWAAHTAIMLMNKAMDASAAASSTAARTMTQLPTQQNIEGTMFYFCSGVNRNLILL